MAGPRLPADITALAVSADLVFAAVGKDIVVTRRLQVEAIAKGLSSGKIIGLIVLGKQLLSLAQDGLLTVWGFWDWQTPQKIIQLGSDFRPSCFMHPDTYVNKVSIAFHPGAAPLFPPPPFPGLKPPIFCISISFFSWYR